MSTRAVLRMILCRFSRQSPPEIVIRYLRQRQLRHFVRIYNDKMSTRVESVQTVASGTAGRERGGPIRPSCARLAEFAREGQLWGWQGGGAAGGNLRRGLKRWFPPRIEMTAREACPLQGSGLDEYSELGYL